jgi:hypothetical protein
MDDEVNRSAHGTYFMTFRNYRTADGELLKWSASFPLPTLGQRIRITMNGIGEAEVVGFFKEEGYVGVMTKALNPPSWLKEQRAREREFTSYAALPQWRKDGIGCEFGAEVGELVAT